MIKIIAALVICFIAGIVVGWLLYRLKTVEVQDKKPAQDSMVANAMQLSNELKDYMYTKDNKVCIRVVKK